MNNHVLQRLKGAVPSQVHGSSSIGPEHFLRTSARQATAATASLQSTQPAVDDSHDSRRRLEHGIEDQQVVRPVGASLVADDSERMSCFTRDLSVAESLSSGANDKSGLLQNLWRRTWMLKVDGCEIGLDDLPI